MVSHKQTVHFLFFYLIYFLPWFHWNQELKSDVCDVNIYVYAFLTKVGN